MIHMINQFLTILQVYTNIYNSRHDLQTTLMVTDSHTVG